MVVQFLGIDQNPQSFKKIGWYKRFTYKFLVSIWKFWLNLIFINGYYLTKDCTIDRICSKLKKISFIAVQ
jgi:hypothetical protein